LYKLVIFDFDGTLVDSAPGIVEVMRLVIERYDLPSAALDQWSHLIGVPLVRQVELVFPDRNPEERHEIVEAYRTIYSAQLIEACPPFAGLKDYLIALKEAGKIITIASSKRRQPIEVVLNHYELTKYFELILGAEDVEHHKPHPQTVLMTLEKFGIEAREAVVIGDSTYDMDMAKGAHVDAIGVLTGIHSREVLSTTHPTYIVATLAETLPIILNPVITVSALSAG
jgi:phosphoglycolate phosphatase